MCCFWPFVGCQGLAQEERDTNRGMFDLGLTLLDEDDPGSTVDPKPVGVVAAAAVDTVTPAVAIPHTAMRLRLCGTRNSI
jgi:hypothetical protein